MEGDMGMRYKGVIFDLDGVICSTDELHYLAWKEIADRCQIPFDREMNDQLRGVSRMESLERILSRGRGEWTQEQKQRLAEEKNARYRELLGTLSEEDILPGVPETLHALRARGLALARTQWRSWNGWACPAGSTQWRMGPRSNGPSRTPRSFCWRRKSSGCLRRTAWWWRTHRQAYRRHRRAAWTRPVSARRQSRP